MINTYCRFFMRLLGTVVGCVMGIVVWYICQGNPYALAIVMFVLNYWMYHYFFYKPFFRIAILMAQITTILVSYQSRNEFDLPGTNMGRQVVCYTYNYILYDTLQPVYEVAGKVIAIVFSL